MNMDSVFFLSCFLPAVLAVYFCLPGIRCKNIALLVFSLGFYLFSGSLWVLLAVATLSWLAGLLQKRLPRRRWVPALAVTLVLSALVAYKYLGFACSLVGLSPLLSGVAAPLGISFFTFKCISYLVDVYRSGEATANYGRFLLYVSFFPQLAQGPITRFSEFAPQLERRSHRPEQLARSARRFVAGLGKKLLISAPLGAVVDRVFALGGGDVRLAWLGAVCYCLQLYFDFSGCIDMAIGVGGLFGFTTRENFREPYTALGIADFWRRWHMSLSAWFKDYIYIPLGGNRRGKLRAGLNKCVVFVLCGLWHGANLTFLLWGCWHGLLSLLEGVGAVPVKRLGKHLPGRVAVRLYTLLAVCLGFVMFRADSVGAGLELLGCMFAGFRFLPENTLLLHQLLTGQVLAMLALAVVLCLPWQGWLARLPRLKAGLDSVGWVLTPVVLVLCFAALAAGDFAPSIYAQF